MLKWVNMRVDFIKKKENDIMYKFFERSALVKVQCINLDKTRRGMAYAVPLAYIIVEIGMQQIMGYQR